MSKYRIVLITKEFDPKQHELWYSDDAPCNDAIVDINIHKDKTSIVLEMGAVDTEEQSLSLTKDFLVGAYSIYDKDGNVIDDSVQVLKSKCIEIDQTAIEIITEAATDYRMYGGHLYSEDFPSEFLSVFHDCENEDVTQEAIAVFVWLGSYPGQCKKLKKVSGAADEDMVEAWARVVEAFVLSAGCSCEDTSIAGFIAQNENEIRKRYRKWVKEANKQGKIPCPFDAFAKRHYIAGVVGC